MASKPGITYDKSELSAIAKSFKAMDAEALTQTKETSNKLADFVNTKIGEAAAQAQAIPKVATRIAFQAVRLPRIYGAGLNLAQTSISNSQFGQVVKVRVRVVGLSIRHCAAFSLK